MTTITINFTITIAITITITIQTSFKRDLNWILLPGLRHCLHPLHNSCWSSHRFSSQGDQDNVTTPSPVHDASMIKTIITTMVFLHHNFQPWTMNAFGLFTSVVAFYLLAPEPYFPVKPHLATTIASLLLQVLVLVLLLALELVLLLVLVLTLAFLLVLALVLVFLLVLVLLLQPYFPVKPPLATTIASLLLQVLALALALVLILVLVLLLQIYHHHHHCHQHHHLQ